MGALPARCPYSFKTLQKPFRWQVWCLGTSSRRRGRETVVINTCVIRGLLWVNALQALCNLIPGTARWSEPLTLLHRQGSRVPQQLRKSPGVTQMAGGRAGHEPGLAGPLSPAACVQICQHLTLPRSQGEDAAEPELGVSWGTEEGHASWAWAPACAQV